MADLEQARAAKRELLVALAGRPGLAVGIAPDADGYGLLVRDTRGGPAHADVPHDVHGVRVRVAPGGPVAPQG
ncbi:hypothetical protein [Cellulomonas oligotrophica]|uniref:Uncharacterized protein n=1 Tax=Cellulomonas oligotrophica TaxID=931536 RepID=A0A7Y9JXZ8_9CELL|nr:hypothetical protein [Cellulomonas oligotrophica]NYD86406.1 hypothetical protein [Cellulomonas oligotrophica]GIG32703.1 hypothetical protein Col01nite_18620 [Cellulomonas oligotrophica]